MLHAIKRSAQSADCVVYKMDPLSKI